MHQFLLVIFLIGTGIIGGLLSTMAGMASLVSYPALLSIGLSPVAANVTNTAAQIFSGIGATVSSSKELRSARRETTVITIWSLIGSACGCALLLVAPAASFERAVPVLIAAAGGLMLYSLLHHPDTHKKRAAHPLVRSVALFLVGIYIGYFGASAGVITLALLSVTESLPFATTNAIKNFVSFTGNALAMVIYAFTAPISWAAALIMGLGFLIGGWLGPKIVLHLPVRGLKFAIAIAAFGLALYLAITTY